MSLKHIFLFSLFCGVLFSTVVWFMVAVSGPRGVDTTQIQHREIAYPAHAKPIDIQCGDKPCVIFYDPEKVAFVALMVDGSTVTVRPEDPEEISN